MSATALTFGNPRTAVTAHIEEGTRDAIVVSGQQDRHAAIVLRHVGIWPPQHAGQTHGLRVTREQFPFFPFELFRTGEDLNRVLQKAVGQGCRAGIDVTKQLLCQVDLGAVIHLKEGLGH